MGTSSCVRLRQEKESRCSRNWLGLNTKYACSKSNLQILQLGGIAVFPFSCVPTLSTLPQAELFSSERHHREMETRAGNRKTTFPNYTSGDSHLSSCDTKGLIFWKVVYRLTLSLCISPVPIHFLVYFREVCIPSLKIVPAQLWRAGTLFEPLIGTGLNGLLFGHDANTPGCYSERRQSDKRNVADVFTWI